MKTKLLLLLSLFVLKSNAQQCWDKISSGAYHTIAISGDGKLWSWGYNNSGQLGDGTIVDKSTPIQIGADDDWVSVGAGYYHSFGIKSNGTLWAWGYNYYGQLGRGLNGNGTNLLVPTQIGTDTNWLSVVSGEYFTLAVKTNGTLWATGKNTNGQLGINNLVDQNIFQQVGTDTDWNKIACGRSHSLALKTNGVLYLWGANGSGQLGFTHTVDRRVPTVYGSFVTFTEIAGGVGSSIAIKSDGKMFRAGYGCPIPGSTYTMAEFVVSPADWVSVKIGSNFVVATKSDGSLWVLGNNDYGQFGNPSFNSSTTFIQPNLGNGWKTDSNSLQVSLFSVLALNSSGQLYGTGQNHVGQLGDSSLTQRINFTAVNCPYTLSNEDFSQRNHISLYPNPVSNQLNISTTLEIQKLAIYDVTGKQVKYQEGNTNAIDVQDLKSGFYLLEVTINDKKEVSKFIKQ
jgi:hypothetical protein